MAFMFRRSWELARSTYFFIVSRAVLGTIQPFALLIVPKYILDELAGQKRVDMTLRYIGLYAAVIIFFNIANLLINRFGIVQNVKTSHRVGMYNTKKWLYMDYGNFVNGQVRELGGQECRSGGSSGFCGRHRCSDSLRISSSWRDTHTSSHRFIRS